MAEDGVVETQSPGQGIHLFSKQGSSPDEVIFHVRRWGACWALGRLVSLSHAAKNPTVEGNCAAVHLVPSGEFESPKLPF